MRALTSITMVLILSVTCFAQDKLSKEEIKKLIDDKLTELDATYKDKTTGAPELLAKQKAIVTALVGHWERFLDPQRKSLRKHVGKMLKGKREGESKFAIETLGSMGGGKKGKEAKASTKTLVKAAGLKAVRRDKVLLPLVFDSIGKLGHTAGVATLTDSLSHKDTKIVVAAIRALAGYDKAKTGVRKEIFKCVLRAIPGEPGSGSQGGGGSGTRRRLNNATFDEDRRQAIEAAANRTFYRLTKEQLTGQWHWTRWWNNTGKRKARW